MLRLPTVLVVAGALVLLPLIAPTPVRAQPTKADAPAHPLRFEDLKNKTQRALVSALGDYLDPDLEFVWRSRKATLAVFAEVEKEDHVNPLGDLPLLRELVYQSRHFLDRFDEKSWQRQHQADYKRNLGIYHNVKSEQWRFTWTVPRSYPSKSSLEKTFPRHEPYPLLVSVHEEQDTVDRRGQTADYPGEAVLQRRYPKDEFEPLYENWFVLAPAAPRAKFMEEDGRVRHQYLTRVLTEFWRHYHVDFDRVVIDGTEPAITLAATFPQVFAGLVIRGGTIHPDEVQNYATVPVFVVGNEKIAKALKAAGHPDVTEGTAKDVVVWLNQRHRVVPHKFSWNIVRSDQLYCNWVNVETADFTAPKRTLSVEVLDTEKDPNTVRIDATGVGAVDIYLNDDVVDLDRDVRLVLNGEEQKPVRVERSFDQCFAKGSDIRKNMDFGWLYPGLMQGVKMPAPKTASTGTEAAVPAPEKVVQGTPEDEKTAHDRWELARKAEGDGTLGQAATFYQAVVAVGETSLKGKAQAWLEAKKVWDDAEALATDSKWKEAEAKYQEVASGDTSLKDRAAAKVKEMQAKQAN